ncbi:hypothetical protein [Pseudomonas rubra]|uniref:Uncharacterized protein n=1 Tax=Pseudomonas rubra TaxID=2942627 RepID=A0ABT5PG72_9PSED|nr:hypothetical protein [Pseudomonas rubra]MDD1016954.1 hypothetical protein [Pseudomonas rubra]MDD1041049.1 hypothetical protein [Pseudomonas rubra]MDD1157476.1 hypothetical protein [Pseudomonas rubra]
MKQHQKVLCVLGCSALVLMPWGKTLEMISPDVNGYYISGGGLNPGYKVLKVDRSGHGKMYSYDAMYGGILNSYPFTYSSSLLSITLNFSDGSQSILSQGLWGLEGLLHCTAGSCGGMGNVSHVGENEADLPEGFLRALSKTNYR